MSCLLLFDHDLLHDLLVRRHLLLLPWHRRDEHHLGGVLLGCHIAAEVLLHRSTSVHHHQVTAEGALGGKYLKTQNHVFP